MEKEYLQQQVIDEVFGLYDKYGEEDYIGEPVSQLEHMCQAAQLAEAEGFDEEVILAAFFHDIGHLCEHIMPVQQMGGFGVMDHEGLGGNYLRQKGFSEKIARLVESHVSAKRYLTYKIPAYYERLSEASKATLITQGGVMTAEEAKTFEEDELYELYIKLRQWDDRAKKTGEPLPPLEKYRRMALSHLMTNRSFKY